MSDQKLLRLSEKKLLKLENLSTLAGKLLLKTSQACVLAALASFGVALVANGVRWRREQVDYADEDL